ncbi:hypothetical protein B0H13DRAFT_183884 [Mycena leptocephala]|nr:hypothetical protein B0H13DRAFT_183884 [Mycena leptocephala]
MPIDYMEAVLSSFSIVDIIHLRSLSCDRFHKPLFLANAHSMEKLELIVNRRPDANYPETIPLPPGLRSLKLKIRHGFNLPSIIRRLGNLATLKRVSITAPEYMEIPCWTHADSLLADVGAKLEELRLDIPMMRYQQQDEVELTIRASMPFMNAKGVLGISFSSQHSYPFY